MRNEAEESEEPTAQSSEIGTVSKIPDEDKQNGENQEIDFKEHNVKANNCITPDNKIKTETPNEAEESEEPLALSSEIGTVSKIPDEDKQNGENQEIDFKEHNGEANNCVTPDNKIKTETPNEAEESEEPLALSSEIGTVSKIPDEDKQNGENQEIDFKEHNVKANNCITPDNKIKTETPNEAEESEEPLALSSEIGTVSKIPDEDKQNGEKQKIDFKEHNDEANNCVTLDEKIETETPNEAGESEKPPAQSSEIGTVSKIPDEDKQNGENQEIDFKEHNVKANNCITPDNKIKTETPNEAEESEEPLALSSEIGTVSKIPDEDKQNGEKQKIDFKEHNDEANNCVTLDEKIETETPNEAGESEKPPAQSSEIGTVSKIPDEDKQNGENQEIDFKEHNDEANNCVTQDNKTETETPNAEESEEPTAQSSEIGTVSKIPDEDKNSGKNQEIDFKEHNDEANNCVTQDNKTETETPNEAEESEEPTAQSSEIGTVSKIPDEDKQNGENQEIDFKEHNVKTNNCITPDNKIKTETPNEAEESEEPLALSSEIGTVSKIPDEDKQNGENQEIDFKEHNGEANNCVTPDNKIKTETPNEAEESEEPLALSSEIGTVSKIPDEDKQNGENQEIDFKEHNVKANNCITPDNKIKTETPNEAEESEEPLALSSEIGTVSKIPDEDKQNGENQEIDFKEHNGEANNCVTPDNKIKTETPNEAEESQEPTAQSSEIGTVSKIPDEDKQNGEKQKIDFKEHNDEANNCVTLDEKIETETPNEAGESEKPPAQSSEIGTVSKIPDEDKQNGENQEVDFKEHNDEASNCVTPDNNIETETPNEAGESEKPPAQSSEIGTVSKIPDDDKQNGENEDIHITEQNDKANNEVTHKGKAGVNYVTTKDIDETAATTEKLEESDRKQDNSL